MSFPARVGYSKAHRIILPKRLHFSEIVFTRIAKIYGEDWSTFLNKPHTSYRFGPFDLRVEEQELWREIPLRPQLFTLLLTLVENQGRLLSKDDLIGMLWPNEKEHDLYVDERLHKTIADLKKQLNLPKGGQDPIETKSKGGYRFKVPVIPVKKASTLATEMEAHPYPNLIERINQTSQLLPKGADRISWIIGSEIVAGWEAKLREFTSNGIMMSRIAMRACRNELLEAAKSIAVVDTSCFDYKTEWSKYWPGWLKNIGERADITAREYYVLPAQPITPQHADNLLAAQNFLSSAGFTLSVCNRTLLEEAIGKALLPGFDSLDIFGHLILRLDIPSTGESQEKPSFAGGHDLQVSLHDMAKEPIYAEVCKFIRENSVEVTPVSIETFQREFNE